MSESGSEQDEDEELQVLVVDPGSAEWRVGFATDDGPSALFAPSAASESFGLLSEQNWSTAFTELEIEPAEHAILLAEQPGMTDMLREQVARLLFEKFRIRALLAVPGALLTLYAMDSVTGVVVDVGEAATAITCVYEGALLLGAVTRYELGGAHVTGWLADQLAKPAVAKQGYRPKSREGAEAAAKGSKESLGYVALDYEGEAPATPEVYHAADGAAVPISGELASTVGEGFFAPSRIGMDVAMPGLSSVVLQAERPSLHAYSCATLIHRVPSLLRLATRILAPVECLITFPSTLSSRPRANPPDPIPIPYRSHTDPIPILSRSRLDRVSVSYRPRLDPIRVHPDPI